MGPVTLLYRAFLQHPSSKDQLVFAVKKRVETSELEKVQEFKQARILVYITLSVCAITVLHERWMQDTPTSHCVTW